MKFNKNKLDAALNPLLQPISELLAQHGVMAGSMEFKAKANSEGMLWNIKTTAPRQSTGDFEDRVRSSPLGALLAGIFGEDALADAFKEMADEENWIEPNAAQLKWGRDNLARVNACKPDDCPTFDVESIACMVRVFINEAPQPHHTGYADIIKFREELFALADVELEPNAAQVKWVGDNAAKVATELGVSAQRVVRNAAMIAKAAINAGPCECGDPTCFKGEAQKALAALA